MTGAGQFRVKLGLKVGRLGAQSYVWRLYNLTLTWPEVGTDNNEQYLAMNGSSNTRLNAWHAGTEVGHRNLWSCLPMDTGLSLPVLVLVQRSIMEVV